MTDNLRERMRQLIYDLPDWAVPVFMNVMERFRGGMPLDDVDRLFRQELPVARAAHEKDLERLTGSVPS